VAVYPNISKNPPKARAPHGGKIRVGFISSHLREHTIYKLYGQWITKLDKERFEVHTFYTGKLFDHATDNINHHSDAFYSRIHSDRELISTIFSAELDVLVYLDIGMDPKMQLPAALRLAPVQCATFGHPVTSGLPTIDYFLGSDLMEPEDADSHYSERLIRLPNLAFCYSFPHSLDAAGGDVHRLRDDGRVVFLCSQSLFKLLPQYDSLYARIAARVPASRFWFIANRSDDVTGQFHKRLKTAFSDQGLSAEERCVIHPQMPFDAFLALNREADVLLDSVLWSGGNTTLEAIASGLPVVTLPGTMMRSRHSAAMLHMMELDEAVARDEDDYVEIAVALGNDRQRQRLAKKIIERRSIIFDDETPIHALEDFFERVCRANGS